MVNSVRMASKRDPLILGKPEKPIFEVLHKAHNVDAARTVIIGDVYVFTQSILLSYNWTFHQ